MVRKSTAIVGVVLAGALGVGCSSAKTSATCDKSAEMSKTFSSLDVKDPKSLDTLESALTELMAKAPDDLKKDLAVMKDQVELIQKARKDPANAASLMAKLDQAALTKAASNAASWEKDNC